MPLCAQLTDFDHCIATCRKSSAAGGLLNYVAKGWGKMAI